MTCLTELEQTLTICRIVLDVVRVELLVTVEVDPCTYEAILQTVACVVTLEHKVNGFALLDLKHVTLWVTVVGAIGDGFTAMVVEVACCAGCCYVSNVACSLSSRNTVGVRVELADRIVDNRSRRKLSVVAACNLHPLNR